MSNVKRNSWILVGAPNSGKTSLFNQLTGANSEVMNYPGSTATSSTAKLKKSYQKAITIIDTPGIYNIDSDSPEAIEVQAVLEQHPTSPIIFVLDCRFLKHRVQLLLQLLSQGFKCVVYCTHVFNSGVNLEDLHLNYGVSFIDSGQSLAIKILIYALDNIDLHFAPKASMTPPKGVSKPKTIDLDVFFLHPWLSFITLIALMVIVFSGIFYVAQPISAHVETLMDWGVSLIQNSQFAGTHPLLGSLVAGTILGVGTLLIFVPQIFLLFAMILFVQESGYLARAAVVLDPIFEKFGLHGKSFVPLLSGFSCAIPAILLTKTIESKKEKLLTILAIPFMVCSARVPMYALCVSFLFYDSPVLGGLVFSGMYLLNLLFGAIAAGIVNSFLSRGQSSYLMMELPPYRLPRLWQVLRAAFRRVVIFLKNAGPIIFGVSLVVWFVTTFPDYENADGTQRLERSYAGQLGQWIEPVFKPMGADWRVGTAILTSFAAREVFVSSLRLLITDTETTPEADGKGIIQNLKNLQGNDGRPLFSTASMIALLVFFMLALQCSSTTIVTAKETKSWGIALAQFLIMNGLAYTLAVITYQIVSGV